MNISIKPGELKELLKKGEITLLDVRRKSDLLQSESKIKGARWHDPESPDTWEKDIPRNKKAVVYCVKGGQVSQSVSKILSEKGVESVYLEGGIKDWQENGLPVEENPDFKA